MLRKLLMVLPLFVSQVVLAGEVPVPQCPSELLVKQTVKPKMIDGWKVVNSERSLPLRYIAVSWREYPVEQTGFNVPSKEDRQANGGTLVYYHTGGDDMWRVCGYADSSVEYVQKLPDNAQHCVVNYPRKNIAPDKITMKCFDTELVEDYTRPRRSYYINPRGNQEFDTHEGRLASWEIGGAIAGRLFNGMPESSILASGQGHAPNTMTKKQGGLECTHYLRAANIREAYGCNVLLDLDKGALLDRSSVEEKPQ